MFERILKFFLYTILFILLTPLIFVVGYFLSFATLLIFPAAAITLFFLDRDKTEKPTEKLREFQNQQLIILEQRKKSA